MTEKNRLIIRRFVDTDLLPLKSLIHRTIALCYPGHYCLEAVRFFVNYHNEEAIRADARDGCTLVLDKAGRALGTGTIVGHEIRRVFVDPALQGWGCGRLLMRRLEERAASEGITTVTLDASLPSRPFYHKLGYSIIEKAFLEVENARRLDFFRMSKELPVRVRQAR
jgi:GNAT superfamily N-acetyltransferase